MNYLKFRLRYLFIFCYVFLFNLNAQTKHQLTQKAYQARMDSLKAIKNSLNLSQKKLQEQVDSLKKYSGTLDEKLQTCSSELKPIKRKLDIKKYGKKIGSRVASGQVWKGMTKEMLKDSWGKPDKTHKNVHPWGVFTQWYYGDITYFFKNGKLIDWEQKNKN